LKKKEVIYFEHGGYPSPPIFVELLADNKGRIVSSSNEKIVNLQEHKILTFWSRVDEIDVWKWKKEYAPEHMICDGDTWELKLRNKNGMAKFSSGHMSYPKYFNDLIQELNYLFNSKLEKL
jgi:hypothetical protein